MNTVLAAIHSVDIDAVGLSDYGPEGNYFERQVARWTKQYRASETEHVADMDALIDWLGANMPADDGKRTLVHGDYRLDNLLFAKDGTDCVAVLDWELSTIGHPYADLAAVIMQWQMPPAARAVAFKASTAPRLASHLTKPLSRPIAVAPVHRALKALISTSPFASSAWQRSSRAC